jgi:hypothetical protein
MAAGTLNQRSSLIHTFGVATGTTLIVVNASGGAAPANPAANQRIGIYKLIAVVSAAATFVVQDTTGAAISGTYNLPANGSVVLDVSVNGDPWYQTVNAGAGLQIVLGTSVTLGYDVYWLPTV